jgi:hypothetical protein
MSRTKEKRRNREENYKTRKGKKLSLEKKLLGSCIKILTK